MKVAMYYSNKDIRIEEQPIPQIGEGELLLKVMASGICGSDVMEWYRIKKAPLVLGHEISAEVVEAGRGVKGFKKGDRVFATHHVCCGECFYCKTGRETVCDTLKKTKFYPGGFAQYLRLPKINAEKGTLLLPAGVSYDAGTFIEPLGCAVRAQRIAGMKKGYIVLVLGSGISGLLHIQLAKALGASKIFATDISEYRLKAAKRFGADYALSAKENIPEKLKELNNGKLADLVIVCAGATSVIKQAVDSVDYAGTILLFAPTPPGIDVPLPLCDMWSKCVNLVTSYAAVEQDLKEALRLIKEKKVDVEGMITHRLPLVETQKGFELVINPENSMKVIIYPNK